MKNENIEISELKKVIKLQMEKSLHQRFNIKSIDENKKFEQVLDVIDFGQVLLDLHEFFEIHPTYEPFSEFEKFQVLDDVVRYFQKEIKTNNEKLKVDSEQNEKIRA